ncbi:MAG: alpha/beta fold hydrolase [Candidatus Rokubacteria bacterium]|nr:alpha/beta fold hydrolase [Candidatus Rokubacteria bacterium]
MPRRPANGIQLYYEEHGSGDPIVCIGGLAGDSRAWKETVDRFAAHHRVILFDNRGTGRSDQPDGPYSTELFADDAAALMRGLGVGRAHIIGRSLGGAIAQHLYLRHPDLVRSLVLASSFARVQPYGDRVFATWREIVKTAGKPLLAKVQSLFFFAPSFVERQPVVVDAAERIFVENTQRAEAYLASSLALSNHDTRARLGEIRAPTLVIVGSEDLLTAVGCSEELAAKIPGARLTVVDDASHFLFLERPRETLDGIMSFIAAC